MDGAAGVGAGIGAVGVGNTDDATDVRGVVAAAWCEVSEERGVASVVGGDGGMER